MQTRAGTRADVPALAGVMARAFHDNPLMRAVVPAGRGAALAAVFSLTGRYVARYGDLQVLDDAGTIVAGAYWLGPERTSQHLAGVLRSRPPIGLVRLGVGGLRRLLAVDRLDSRLHAALLPAPHRYLMSVGVDPDQSGRGLGTRLLSLGLADADEEGLPCYLETSDPRTVPLYLRLGFEVASRVQSPLPGIEVIAMLRSPR